MLADFDGFYRTVGDNRFEPSVHAQGAWQETEQHMAPVAGLLAHCLQAHQPRPELQLCRITFEILGMIAADVTSVQVETIRPGRTIELLEASLIIAGRRAVRATGWRLSRQDTTAIATAPAEADPLPDPETCIPWEGAETWPGGYIRAVDIRRSPDSRPGRARAWVGTRIPLIADTEVSDLATFTGLVDTANGVGARLDPRRWMFPNTDLSVHYFRTPSLSGPRGSSAGGSDQERAFRGIGLETSAAIGPDGVGLTSSTLFDASGPVGRAEQILTVRPLG